MNNNEVQVLRYVIDHPRAELQQICVGVGLPVAKAQPAIDALFSRGILQMSYGTGGAGTQYIAPNGQKYINEALRSL